MMQQQRISTASSQQQRQYQTSQSRVKVGNSQRASISSTNGQAVDLMTASTCDRRTQLGQSFYQDAKKTLGEALSCDESGSTMDALELYNKALCSIRSGLAVLRSSVGAVPAADSALRDLKAKMENLKDQIKSRMEDLLELEVESRRSRRKENLASSQAGVGRHSQCSPRAGGVVRNEGAVEPNTEDKAAADLMFHMDTGIGLFEVDKNDHVMKFDDVDAVSVFQYQHQIEGQPPAFLQCGGFIYPLVPGQSPVLKSGDKIYMFPDLRKEDGSSVGISLESASSADLAHLDQLLTQMADLKTTAEVTKMAAKSSRREEGKVGVAASGSKTEPTWGTTVAGGIDKGVSWVSTKIAKGTEMAGNLVIKGASKLRERIEPEEKPAEIPVAVERGMHYTRRATGCVVSVSDFLMSSLAKLTVRAGVGVKNMVQESEIVKGHEVNPHAKEAWKVTKSSVKGAAGVFTDLKHAASAVVRTAGKESSRTVGHKYGPDAEKVADDALVATGNTVNLAATYWSWKTWGITFLGKIGEVISKENEEKNENSAPPTAVKSSS